MRNAPKDIIVVDDNPVLLATLCQILQGDGCEVRCASDGFSALEHIRARIPDILLSDLNMPVMSGFELLSVVRRRFPAIAVIAMSGAYSGSCVPPDVPADAFYPKGASRMDQLLELVGGIGIGQRRGAVPIWIHTIQLTTGVVEVLLATCPECLRPFCFRPFRNVGDKKQVSCSHCAQRSEIALVGDWGALDRTPLFRPAKNEASSRGPLSDLSRLHISGPVR